MEAARRAPSLEKEIEALTADGRKLGFPKDPMKRFQEVNLKPEEAFVLSRVDGTQTAKDIFTVSPLSEETTARTLFGLLQAELIEPEGVEAPKEKARAAEKPAEAPAPLHGRTPEVRCRRPTSPIARSGTRQRHRTGTPRASARARTREPA